VQYRALYRKYRPQRFDEVIGQDHVIDTLTREVVDGKVAHAYLFAGPRGTGKTTTARLVAKALNCENRGADGEPCNECASCLGISAGTSLDVIELDAASHNKVDDVREIRINVGTVAAAAGARRVYILDEAHMLSRAVGNALLKTLEEPPEHVVFVLATTEPYKLLDTIRSRAQRFDFHQVATEHLVRYLAEIAEREGFSTTPDGLTQVAAHAGGSVRDAMSLLEQVAALGGGTVDAAGVGRALGTADDEAFAGLVAAIAEQNAPEALGIVARLSSQGSDLRRFVSDAVGFLRGIFLAQYAPNLEEVADEPPETLDRWRAQAGLISSADLLRTIDLFAVALDQLRDGREERLVVELTVLKATRPETSVDGPALTTRLDRIERRVRELESGTPPSESAVATPPPPPGAETVAASSADADPPGEAGAQGPAPMAVPEDEEDAAEPAPNPESSVDVTLSDFTTAWPAIVARVRTDVGPRRHALLKEATPTAVAGGVVTFEVPDHLHFHLEQLRSDDELQRIVTDLAAELCGAAVRLQFTAGNGGEAAPEPEPQRAPDKDRMEDAANDDADDPTRLVTDLLGGEIVSE